MKGAELVYGEEVIVPWAHGVEVRGTVREIYGTPPRVHVVVDLTPELTGTIVDQPTTVSLPIDSVRKAARAS
jgi:hypothetical protein